MSVVPSVVPEENIRLVAATTGDLADVVRLLGELELPTEGVTDQFPGAYVIAKGERETTVGCAGLETYARVGLLRSVAVRRSAQGSGIGRRLVQERIAAARALGLDAMYLLTTTAADYFPRLGFVRIDRADFPEALASSPELASVCPASARGFVLRL